MNIDIDNIEKSIKRFRCLAWVLICIGIAAGLFYFFYKLILNPNYHLTFTDIGTYYSGALASIFTLAGLFFIYIAFLGQKQQFIKQQEQLEKQQQQIDKQNQIINLQRFENIYFSLISNFINQINSLYFKNKQDEIYSGITVIKYFFEYYRDSINKIISNKSEDVFKFTKDQYNSIFSNIFNVILLIFKYIDKNTAEYDDKFYTDYLKIQIPEYLKFIIAIYRIHDKELDIVKELVCEQKVIVYGDFRNYLNENIYDEFMSLVGILKTNE